MAPASFDELHKRRKRSYSRFLSTASNFSRASGLSYNGCGAQKFQLAMIMMVAQGTSPEEEELAARRAELTWLRTELATQECQLTDLKTAIAVFEERYLHELGELTAQLVEWKARLASRPAAERGRRGGSARVGAAQQGVPGPDSGSHEGIVVKESGLHSLDLKSLYRDAAKLVHPDTAASEHERAARERSMKEVNAAYLSGDQDTLRRIVIESRFSPDAVEGDGIGPELIRVLRQIRQVQNRIAAVEHETVDLSRSELGLLKRKADLAAREGRDLLAEMAIAMQVELDGIRRRYGNPPATDR